MKYKIGIVFAIIVIASNVLVNYRMNDWLTYGALLFPIGFLLTDIVSEKYGKEFSLSCLKYGILFAFIPTLMLVDYRIAIASLVSYFLSQYLDIKIFLYLKNKIKAYWWVRSNISTFISQSVDSFLFFFIAFYGVMDTITIITLSTGTLITKYIIAAMDTPVFYYFAIRSKK